MSKKSLRIALLIVTVVSGFWLAGFVHSGLAQNSASFKVSGYILDSNGRGIQGAEIIFNVPSMVPSVYSDYSGY